MLLNKYQMFMVFKINKMAFVSYLKFYILNGEKDQRRLWSWSFVVFIYSVALSFLQDVFQKDQWANVIGNFNDDFYMLLNVLKKSFVYYWQFYRSLLYVIESFKVVFWTSLKVLKMSFACYWKFYRCLLNIIESFKDVFCMLLEVLKKSFVCYWKF